MESGYFLQDCLAQQQLQQQGQTCYCGEDEVGFVASAVLAHVHLCLFQLIYLLIYFTQLGVVGGTIELSFCGISYGLQRAFVNLNRYVEIFDVTSDIHGVARCAIGSDADGVDTYAEAACYLGCRLRRYVACVVGTVGEQDDDLGLGLGVL